MSKPLSKREQDLARRNRAAPDPADPAKQKRNRMLGLSILTLAVGLLVWAAWPDGPIDTPEANIEAFGLADDPFMGNPDSGVALVGYESPRCSACQQFHHSFLPTLKAEFFDTGDAAYHYVQGTIRDDFEMSVAQECAYEHGGNPAFWRMTDMFYARSSTYSQPDLEGMLRQVADEQSLDGGAMVACLDGLDTSKKVSQDWSVGSDFGARGTPTFWVFGVEGEAIQVNADQIRDVLRSEIAKARSTTA